MKYLREMVTEKFHPKDVMQSLQLILLISKKIENYLNIMIRKTGLTMAQYTVLQMLAEKDNRPLHEFTSFCHCAPATMTGIVDTLEKKELVKREHSQDDRRTVLVHLTDKGQKIIHSTPTFREIFKNCCLGVSDIDVRKMNDYLKKIDEYLNIS